MMRYYTRACNFYFGKQSKTLINKNIYAKNKEDLKVEDDDQSSALGSMGLKPKIVH